jgi:septal ring factor EnvC (AmiA/AmiB activator)
MTSHARAKSFPRVRIALLAATAGVVALFGVGCGSNPPCTVDLASVDAARGRAMAAERKLEEAENQKDVLRKQIEEAEAEHARLEERIFDLEAELHELQR